MLLNILAIIFLMLGAYISSEGIKIGIKNPLYLIIGALCLLVSYLIYILPNSNLRKLMKTEKGGFFWNLNNSTLRLPAAFFLLIIALGNTIYLISNAFSGGGLGRFEFIFAIISALLAFGLLNKS